MDFEEQQRIKLFKSSLNQVFAGLSPENISYNSAKNEIQDRINRFDIKYSMDNYPGMFEEFTMTVNSKLESDWRQAKLQRERDEKRYYLAAASEIPAAAKSVMKHRSACGVKLSDKDLSRFWSKIDVKGANECWPWKNSLRGSLGYGQFRIGDKICDAHRVALELKDGPLKKGRYVCHSCDSPKCCNPRHLFAGTQKNNMDDMTEKGRGDN